MVRKHRRAKKCPRGKHRNGKRCVKNRTAGARRSGRSGSRGEAGHQGDRGPQGDHGSPGPPGPEGHQGPEGKPPVKTGEVVYDNITPESLIENVPSLGYEATGTAEFGQLVDLAGNAREAPEVTALMSIWACQSGDWTNGCTTIPGAKFAVPITLNIYDTSGQLVDHETETFELPFRPTSDPECGEEGGHYTRFKDADGICDHGMTYPIDFHLHGVTLPDEVIVSVAFSTGLSGYAPTGRTNDPAEALNLGLEGPPSIGTDPEEGSFIWAATGAPNHGGGELPNTEGVFTHVAESWSGYEAAISITADR